MHGYYLYISQVRSEYGCVNYLPKMNDKDLYHLRQELAVEGTMENWRESYPLQRHDIVEWIEKGGKLQTLLDKWPLLGDPQYLFEHFQLLMGFSIVSVSENIMEVTAEQLVQFWTFKR